MTAGGRCSFLRAANSKMMQIDDKRRGPRQRAKNESYMQASLILLILQSTSLTFIYAQANGETLTENKLFF